MRQSPYTVEGCKVFECRQGMSGVGVEATKAWKALGFQVKTGEKATLDATSCFAFILEVCTAPAVLSCGWLCGAVLCCASEPTAVLCQVVLRCCGAESNYTTYVTTYVTGCAWLHYIMTHA